MSAISEKFTHKKTQRKMGLHGILAILVAASLFGSGCAGIVSGNSANGGNTPLAISSSAAASVKQASAVVMWQTNIAATSQVAYGLTTSYGATTTPDSTMVTSHQQTLAGLKPNSMYHFKVTSTDAQNQSASSADQTFTTMADTTPPAISITAPVAGVTLNGIVTVAANATDDVSVASVQFKVDGANNGAGLTAAPYTISLDTKTLSNGNHVLSATATDEAGNATTSATVAVKVDNTAPDTTPPTVSMTSPAGGTVTGTVSVTANATDNVGVASLQFQLDGANVGTLETAAPFSFSWDSTKAANGTHTWRAIAKDAAGNTGTSATVTVTVNNTTPDTTPPTVSITAPTGGTVSGTVSVTANATDNVGVASVQFQLDGANVGSLDTTAPYAFSWNTTTATNGTHTLKAVAKDAAGNTGSSAAVTVTVNNTTPDTTPPTVSITAPAGGTVSGTVSVTATATDNVGVASVQFQLDGANVGTLDTTAPYAFSWNTTTATNGTHTLKAVAKDAAGNTGSSAVVTVTVNNTTPDTTPPTVSITAPTGGTVSGTVSVTANATDNVGVASVQFQLDGANVGTLDTTAPYAFSWNTTTATNGTHTLKAVAKDAAGNTGTSAAVTVTVNNATADTTPPSTPSGLSATAASSSQINLTWTASTDNVGVTGYNVYRGGTKIGTSTTATYADAGLTASTTFSYMVAAFDAAGNVSGQSTSASATTLVASTGNQIPSSLGWFQIPNTHISGLCPSYPEIQAGSGCASIMSAWSGALFDTKRNRLVIKGGGHSDYYGNEIYAIDFNANPIAPVLVHDASHGSAISNVNSTPEAFNDGTPNARHTYNGWVYLPTQDSYLLYGAGLSTDGPFTDGQWLYNPSGSSWSQQHPSTHPNTSKTGSIPQHAYDPVNDKVYFVEGNAGTFWQMDPATGAWTNLANSGAACGNDNATSAIDPVRRLYACVGNGELFTVSLNSPFTVTNDTSASGCGTLASTNSPGFAYDPVQQLFVGWAGGNTVYTYNPSTHKCAANTAFTGGPTTIQPNGTFGRFRYAPAMGVFVVINDINSNAYSLRLTPVGGTSGGPNITGVTANTITTSSLNVAWTTDVAATSQVEYGTTTAYGTMTTLNSSMVTSHTVGLSGLAAGTAYHYRVHSKNAGGVESISADSVVATNNTVDTTPPTVSVTSPAANATVSGTVNITANASDNQSVASVQFTLDGANVGAASTVAPYTASWDTTTATNGAHTLSAVAKDPSGNVGNAISVPVNVSNTGAAASNFQALCTAPGVVKCVTWDNAADFTPATGGGGYASGAYPAEDGTYQITQDTSSKVDGAGALKFNIRPGSQHAHGTNPAGYWLQQFGTDGAPQHFGEGTTLYLQFRFKVSASMLTYDWTQAGGEGWKVFIVWGPVPGQSCTSDQFVQENTNQTNIATGYVSCGTPGLYSNGGNPPMNLEQGDYNCAYAGSGAKYTAPNCFVYPADTWITEYWVVHIGTFGQPNSNFQAWIASEGQPLKQFINLPNFNFGDGSDHTVGLNAIELTPYFSGANGSTTTPAASMWFDDLIISTQPIAAPNN